MVRHLYSSNNYGLHYPESRFYTRRIRLSVNSELVEPLKKAGYKIEPAFGSEESTLVVEIPVDVGEGIRTLGELTIWEQFSIMLLQRHCYDNQVSCIVTFDPEKEENKYHVLNYYQYHLKGISLLPRHDYGRINKYAMKLSKKRNTINKLKN